MEEFFIDEEESNGDIEVKNDIYNYKGYFVENEEEEEKKFYEFGAHFPYKYLYQKLEIIAKEREEKQKELENKLKEKELKNKENINEESKTNNNLQNLLKDFQQKGKSRNRVDLDNGLTYMPQMNNKNKYGLNCVDNIEINLVKSTSGQNENKSKNVKSSIISKKTRSKIKDKNTDKKKSIKSASKQIKIRKRNYQNLIYINNSLYNNINIFNKKLLCDKKNKKNLTQDIQVIYKFDHTLKSFQNSKEKLRKQILKKEKIVNKNIINNFRNYNKNSRQKCFGYLNTKNISVTKNLLAKEKSNKKIMKNNRNSSGGQRDNINILNNKNKTNKSSNLNIHKTDFNNNKSFKRNNYLNDNKGNNLQFLGKKDSQIRIINKQNNKYESFFKDSSKKKKNEVIENIGKNNNFISRNNNRPLFNNISLNNTNKIFNSVNSLNNNKGCKNYNKYNSIEINLISKNNFANLTQQLKPDKSNKKIDLRIFNNQKSISKVNIRNNQLNVSKNKNPEINHKKNTNPIYQNKINIINIQSNFKKHNENLKHVSNLKEKCNKSKNTNLYVNNLFIKGISNMSKKRNQSKNKKGGVGNEKLTDRLYKALLKNKQKQNININININNQNNIFLNKNNSGMNNNSSNICSVRLNDNKKIK